MLILTTYASFKMGNWMYLTMLARIFMIKNQFSFPPPIKLNFGKAWQCIASDRHYKATYFPQVLYSQLMNLLGDLKLPSDLHWRCTMIHIEYQWSAVCITLYSKCWTLQSPSHDSWLLCACILSHVWNSFQEGWFKSIIPVICNVSNYFHSIIEAT